MLISFRCIALTLCVLWGLLACNAPRGPSDEQVKAQTALGQRLFTDTRLSGDGQVSCASCHRPEQAFSDGRPTSLGIGGQAGTRNAPSLLGAALAPRLFWDGRESDLMAAVTQPFTNPVEMGLDSTEALLQRLRKDPEYQRAFDAAFSSGSVITQEQVATALAAFVRSLQHHDSAYDRHRSGQRNAIDADQVAGLTLFSGKARCGSCHLLEGQPAPLTDSRFHHLGVSDQRIAGQVAHLIGRLNDRPGNLGHVVLSDADIAGLGRFAVTRKPEDLAAFRTPSLRNVAVTAPYMHDGSVATLEAAVDQEIYYRGLNEGRPLSLTVEERRQLLAFLRALTDTPYAPTALIKVRQPQSPSSPPNRH